VILIDARKGVLTQTRRHSYLVQLMGIRHAVLAVNKMDLVGWSRETFEAIVADYARFAEQIGLKSVLAIPLSGLTGDNVTTRSGQTPWYSGPSLMEHLETVEIDEARRVAGPFLLRGQRVNRPNAYFRGFAGKIVSGRVKPGDAIRVAPSGNLSTVEHIVTKDGDLGEAIAGQSVTLTLA